jgi:hypothetical protein
VRVTRSQERVAISVVLIAVLALERLKALKSVLESAPVVVEEARPRDICWPESESPFALPSVTASCDADCRIETCEARVASDPESVVILLVFCRIFALFDATLHESDDISESAALTAHERVFTVTVRAVSEPERVEILEVLRSVCHDSVETVAISELSEPEIVLTEVFRMDTAHESEEISAIF